MMNRRDMMKCFGLGATAGFLGLVGKENDAVAQTYAGKTKGLPPLKITKVKA